MGILFIFLSLFICFTSPRQLQDQDDNLLRNPNLKSLVNFNIYDNSSQRKLISSLPEWTINQIQQGIGSFYNPRWGTKVVTCLDYFKNFFLRQNIPLIKGTYTFSMKFAARSGWAGSSGMSIYWNLQKLKTIFPEDEQIKYLNIDLQPQRTQNILQIRGEGIEDSYGMTIADLRLSYKGPIKPKDSGIINLINNSLENIEKREWKNQQMEMVNGYLYNKRWGLSKVLLLNSSGYNILRQNLILNPQYYVFSMDYAVPTNYTKKSGISIYWNANLIKRLFPEDQNISRLSLALRGLNRQNNLILQLQPQTPDSAITISNLKLFPTNIPASLPLANKVQIPIRNQITLIPSSLFGSQMTSLVPYWQSRGFTHKIGYYHNPRWQDKVVLISDPGSNGFLKRLVNLQKGVYQFLFDYATKDDTKVYPKMITYFNDRPVGIIQPKNNEIYTFNLSFGIQFPTKFNLELRVDSNNIADGISLYNPQVIPLNNQNNKTTIPIKTVQNTSKIDQKSLSSVYLPKQLYSILPYLIQPASNPQIIVINQRQPSPPTSQPTPSPLILIGNIPLAQNQTVVTKTTTENKIGDIDFADIPTDKVSTKKIDEKGPSTPIISNKLVDGSNSLGIQSKKASGSDASSQKQKK